LLGTAGNDAIAALANYSANVVRQKRARLGIPNPSGHGWTAEELRLLGTAPDAEVAALLGRFEPSVFAAHIDEVGTWYNRAPSCWRGTTTGTRPCSG